MAATILEPDAGFPGFAFDAVALQLAGVSTVFLLSPARCNGERAEMLVASRTSELGARLRDAGAPIADVFSWLSALYFRGKVAYARKFGKRAYVMAPGLGLVALDHAITALDLQAMGKVAIESEPFTAALRRDALRIRAKQVVLLGSIATGKYVDTLLDVFGTRLVFPACFVGRGDMSRGGLMLRASRSGEPLEYIPVAGAKLHGVRPPKLPKLVPPTRTTSR